MVPQRIDFLAIGEVLVDLIASEPKKSLSEARGFERCFGGAPANVAVNVAQLGGRSALIAKMGDDPFGAFLRERLEAYGVITQGVVIDPHRRTSLTFITQGIHPPQFDLRRDADLHLTPEEIEGDLIEGSRIVHTSAFALAEEPSRSAVLLALAQAKGKGRRLSLDINYREKVWLNGDEAREVVGEALKSIDMVKASLEDVLALFGKEEREDYLERLHRLGPGLAVLTLGGEGCLVSEGGRVTHIPTFPVEAVDWTGAGDAFWAGFILALLDGRTPERAARLGNRVAAIKGRGLGAIAPLPHRKEIYRRLEGN